MAGEAGGVGVTDFDPKKQYRCTMCREIFDLQRDEDWNEDKARTELEQKFPGVGVEDCDIVCDECYKRIMHQ